MVGFGEGRRSTTLLNFEECALPEKKKKKCRGSSSLAYRSYLSSLQPSVGREMSSNLRVTGRRPSVADWGGGTVVCLSSPRVQLFISAGNGWPHNATGYH